MVARHGVPTVTDQHPERPKPCPFKHKGDLNTNVFVRGEGNIADETRYYVVECGGCGAQGPASLTYEEAIESWNRRA